MLEDNLENVKKCICFKCPSHNKCMKERGLVLFCARTQSNCEVHRHGCLCNICPVAKENNLTGTRYCEKSKDNKS